VRYTELEAKVDEVRARLTPATLERLCQDLLRQGEEPGGGIGALRVVKHLLGDPDMRDGQAVWAYDRLKPAFRAALEQIPSLYYFHGD
jgi:hypothetical protein